MFGCLCSGGHLLAHKVNKAAHFGFHVLAVHINGVKRGVVHGAFGQKADKFAGGDVVVGEPCGHIADAYVGADEGGDHLGVVAAHFAALEFERHGFALVFGHHAGQIHIGGEDGGVPGKVLRGAGRAVPGEVGGGGDEVEGDVAQPFGDDVFGEAVG